MRIVSSGRFTQVSCLDGPGQGNACHEYRISRVDNPSSLRETRLGEFGDVHFQNGPIQEFGVNGCHNEDLLAIVIDRLRGFNSGEFRCRENALALTKLEEALHWLNARTEDRQNRGVEGLNVR